jgi:putative spermidine/putrescine transport system permease protein
MTARAQIAASELTKGTPVASPPLRQGRRRLAGWQLGLPLGIFYLVFLVAPLAILFFVSLFTDGTFTKMGPDQYVTFFTERLNYVILFDTLKLGVITTFACVVFGFPLALAYLRAPARFKPLLMFLIILPQLTSSVVRTFAWVVIMGRQGIINSTLASFGLPPMTLLYTTEGVVIALMQIQLPLMVLPLINALARQDPSLVEASSALGASRWRTFFKVILPLSLPAIYAGSLLVFTSTVSAFVTQSIIGGGRLTYMPKYIYDLSKNSLSWPFAAAAVIALLVTVLFAVMAFNALSQSSLRRAEG